MGGNPTMWIFVGFVLFGRVETSRVGGWCSMKMGGHPGAWILEFLDTVDSCFMDFSYWPHMSYA